MPSWFRGPDAPVRAAPQAAAFRAKGLVYQGALAFYDQVIVGGSAAVLKTLGKVQPSAELGAFFAQSFVAGGWYDVLPVLPLCQAAAHVAGMAQQRVVRDNAAWLARRDLNGVYKAIISLASAEMVAKRLPALSMRYFDFGGTGETASTSKSMSTVRTGIPHSLGDWFMHCTEGFVPVALALAGAADVRVRCAHLDDRSDAGDGRLVAFKIEVNWS